MLIKGNVYRQALSNLSGSLSQCECHEGAGAGSYNYIPLMANFSSYHLKGQHFEMNKGYFFSSLFFFFFNLRQDLTM